MERSVQYFNTKYNVQSLNTVFIEESRFKTVLVDLRVLFPIESSRTNYFPCHKIKQNYLQSTHFFPSCKTVCLSWLVLLFSTSCSYIANPFTLTTSLHLSNLPLLKLPYLPFLSTNSSWPQRPDLLSSLSSR